MAKTLTVFSGDAQTGIDAETSPRSTSMSA
jgi:hypothetical protein